MNAFRQFVEDNIRWFSGHHHETDATLNEAEKQLGVQLPEDLRWLLKTHGYWHATGIDSLDGSIKDTLEGREVVKLPERFVVLANNGYETYAELLDTVPDPVTGLHHVHFVAWEEVSDVIPPETVAFPSYMDHVRDILERAVENVAEENIDYDPRDFRYN